MQPIVGKLLFYIFQMVVFVATYKVAEYLFILFSTYW